jgi:hypothetical protein
VTLPVVFAGYGISAPELGYDDYQGVDVRDAAVVVFMHEPQENDPDSRFEGTGLHPARQPDAEGHGRARARRPPDAARHRPVARRRRWRVLGWVKDPQADNYGLTVVGSSAIAWPWHWGRRSTSARWRGRSTPT